MNKTHLTKIIILSIFFIFFFKFSITGLASIYDINVNVSDSVWVEDVPDTILLINSTTFVVDGDLSSQGNGHCTSISESTFLIIDENTSKVDCEIDSDKLSITPAVNFTGNSTCEVRCSSSDFEDINFTIFVIETTDPEPESTSTALNLMGTSRINFLISLYHSK